MTSSSRTNPFRDTRVAQEYDPWYADRLGATVDRLQKALVLKLARPRAGERALDVGTGTGNYACALARLGLRVTGIDASEAMLSVARAKREPVTWQQGDAEHLPFEDASFHLVVTVTALEFFADPEHAIGEMVRVLAPGGRLVVGTLNARGPWGEMYAAVAKDPASPFHHARLYTSEELITLLAPYGPVSWSSAVFVPPTGKGLAFAGIRERFGQALQRDRGALLVGRIDK